MCSTAFSQNKLVALSFDDGPNTTTTVQMLDVLKKHNVKASFFVIGKNINEESAKVMVRAHNEGHDIENHSKTHSAMPTLSADSIKSEIEFTSALVAKYVGERPQLFRPPYIALTKTMFDNIDLTFICGEGSNDWEDNVSADQRVEKILASAKDGLIYLLHDFEGNGKTVEAVDRIKPSAYVLVFLGCKIERIHVISKASDAVGDDVLGRKELFIYQSCGVIKIRCLPEVGERVAYHG